jgi:hypothetical protein
MGISIVLVDCNGDIVDRLDDTANLLHKILPPASEDSGSLLSKIDWYGETYFNYLQMKQFLGEWKELLARARTSEEKALISCVRDMARRCRKTRDVLTFVGD